MALILEMSMNEAFIWLSRHRFIDREIVTRSAKKVHKSLYAFTCTGPFYVERGDKIFKQAIFERGNF